MGIWEGRHRESWKDFWHNSYAVILSLLTVFGVSSALKSAGIFKILLSKNMPNALDAVMTFTSIVLGFMGVLLTALAGIKGESKIIRFFLKWADEKSFLRVVRSEIVSGLCTALLTIALYFPSELIEIFGGRIVKAVFIVWLLLILYFLLSTYRLMSLFLRMIFDSGETACPPEPNATLPTEERIAMEEKYKDSQ